MLSYGNAIPFYLGQYSQEEEEHSLWGYLFLLLFIFITSTVKSDDDCLLFNSHYVKIYAQVKEKICYHEQDFKTLGTLFIWR